MAPERPSSSALPSPPQLPRPSRAYIDDLKALGALCASPRPKSASSGAMAIGPALSPAKPPPPAEPETPKTPAAPVATEAPPAHIRPEDVYTGGPGLGYDYRELHHLPGQRTGGNISRNLYLHPNLSAMRGVG